MVMRVLVLCGYTQSAAILRRHMRATREACEDVVDFVFVDPSQVMLQPTLDPSAALAETPAVSEVTPRSWWEEPAGYVSKELGDGKRYLGLDESLAKLRRVMEDDVEGFDGVLGFSQGGVLASLLTSVLERPNLHPAFAGKPAIKPFRFAIFCSAFLPTPTVPDLRAWYPIAPTPTLHVVGRTDVVISEKRSLALFDQCDDARLEYHDGGHFVPVKPKFREFFRDYIASFDGGSQGDVPPPRPSPPNSTASSPSSSRRSSLE